MFIYLLSAVILAHSVFEHLQKRQIKCVMVILSLNVVIVFILYNTCYIAVGWINYIYVTVGHLPFRSLTVVKQERPLADCIKYCSLRKKQNGSTVIFLEQAHNSQGNILNKPYICSHIN